MKKANAHNTTLSSDGRLLRDGVKGLGQGLGFSHFRDILGGRWFRAAFRRSGCVSFLLPFVIFNPGAYIHCLQHGFNAHLWYTATACLIFTSYNTNKSTTIFLLSMAQHPTLVVTRKQLPLSNPLLIQLYIIGGEKALLAFVFASPPILVGEFQVGDCCILREADFCTVC